MSVGGKIIEIARVRIHAGDYPGYEQDANRYWCMDDHGDEVCVHGEPLADGPKLGDPIWWQEKRIYFDGDRRWMRKIGNSYRAAAIEDVPTGGRQ